MSFFDYLKNLSKNVVKTEQNAQNALGGLFKSGVKNVNSAVKKTSQNILPELHISNFIAPSQVNKAISNIGKTVSGVVQKDVIQPAQKILPQLNIGNFIQPVESATKKVYQELLPTPIKTVNTIFQKTRPYLPQNIQRGINKVETGTKEAIGSFGIPGSPLGNLNSRNRYIAQVENKYPAVVGLLPPDILKSKYGIEVSPEDQKVLQEGQNLRMLGLLGSTGSLGKYGKAAKNILSKAIIDDFKKQASMQLSIDNPTAAKKLARLNLSKASTIDDLVSNTLKKLGKDAKDKNVQIAVNNWGKSMANLMKEMPEKFATEKAVLPKQVSSQIKESLPENQISQEGLGDLKNVKITKNSEAKTLLPGILSNTEEKVSKKLGKKSRELSDKFDDDFSFENTITKDNTNVKDKINLLDKIRTPEYVMKKIGMKKEMDLIRKQYDKYLKELPEEIDKVREWESKTTPEENQNIFRYLDGQGVQLSQKELNIANEVKTYLKNWADKLKLPKENRISNYITHIFDKDFVGNEFPEEIAKIIDDKIAGSVYDPFTLKRLGKLGYKEDTWLALEAYVKRGTRKYNMDVALEQVKKKAKTLELSQFKYVKNYIDRINLRPTDIDTMLDNTIRSVIGNKLGQRPTASITKTARQIIYRGALGLNISSALKNLSQGANTYAKLGEKYTITGYANLLKNWKNDELEKVGVLADDFIQDRTLSVYKKGVQKLDNVLFYVFSTAEKINRGAAYYGAKARALNNGLSEEKAIEEAKKLVRQTQFSFGSIDTPPILQSDIGKTLGQFQSFSLKQGEFLAGMIKEKDIAGLVRYTAATLLFIYGIGKSFGMSPKDMIPILRIGTPPTLKLPVESVKSIFSVPNKYGQPTSKREVLQAAVPIMPGGVQIKKSFQGIKDLLKGKSETDTGRVRFNIEKTPSNIIKSALFGPYATKEGIEYIKEDRTPSSQSTVDANRIYKDIKDAKTQEEKKAIFKEYVQSGKLNDEVSKKILDIANDEALGMTKNEKTIRNSTIENRAEYVVTSIQNLKTQEEKKAFFADALKKGILSDNVSKYIIEHPEQFAKKQSVIDKIFNK